MPAAARIPVLPQGVCTVQFPQRCICCGAPKDTESTILINRLVMRKNRQHTVTIKLQAPHCERCARSTKSVFLAGLIPFLLGFISVGGVVFIAVTLIANAAGMDDYNQYTPGWYSGILGAAAGLISGLVSGFLFELAARILLLPVFGEGLLRAPLLAMQFLNDSDYVAGLTVKPDAKMEFLTFIFHNEEIAREFGALNLH
jgi:hypothetical protein